MLKSGVQDGGGIYSARVSDTVSAVRPIEILLVEDSPSDTQLTVLALEESKVRNRLNTVEDGVQAMRFLRREGPYAHAPQPDVILLDLGLPRMSGQEVLAAVRADPQLQSIPVVVLTSSRAHADIVRSYRLQANCYVTKPVDAVQLVEVVKQIEFFWLCVVRLPMDPAGAGSGASDGTSGAA